MAMDDQEIAERADAALLGAARRGEGGNAVLAFRNLGKTVEAGCGEHGRRPEIAEDARDDRRRRIAFPMAQISGPRHRLLAER
jgi:hypothetical protein